MSVDELHIGEVELVKPVEKLIPSADPAKKVEAKGIIKPDDLGIFLTQELLAEIHLFSSSDLDHELGGVLVGDLQSYRGVPYLEIRGYIQARHYKNTAASFRFTHDSWSAISREREQKWNDKLVVGWHHTHPGYGVWLSEIDKWSHRHFFNLPWMVALVVDPKRAELGFFQWKNGVIKDCGFYFVR